MFHYIDTPAKLHQLLAELDAASWVALDTEFIREKTYYPRLCLIQIASPDVLACIDPLAIPDLGEFYAWLAEPARLKVLHAAWQDLEIIHHVSGHVPAPVFDTQIAAAALGLGEQLGYARLVESLLGISLDKTQARTDWARRPLSKAQLEYAIDDVRHLREVYLRLYAELERLGRLGWLEKAFQKLADPAAYRIDPDTSWERVKGLQILKPQQLAVLRALAAWREQQAIFRDIPRRWVLTDEILLDMARMQPAKVEDFANIRGLAEDQISRHAPQWLACIAQAQSLPKEACPSLPRRRKLDAQLSVVADLLTAVLNQIAHQHGIAAQMVATRSQIERMLEEGRTTLADDWRGALVNEAFGAILAGNACVKVRGQQIVVEI